MKLKRVLVFGMTKNAGGVESVIMNYYRFLDRKKIQFDFLCNGDEIAYYNEIKSLGGKVFFITPISKNVFKYKKELKDFFKNNASNYDAIWMNVCALSNIDYLKYAKKYGIKKRIIHSHNSQSIESRIKRIFHNMNKNKIYDYATDYWACSKKAGEYFFDKNEFKLINNAIDLNKFKFDEIIRNKIREELGIRDKFVIGNVARFHFQKNHKFLIKIFNEVKKKKKNVILLLIGDGEDIDKIKKIVYDLNLQDSVMFLGKRNDTNLLYQAMDVFVLPSLFEGLPVVLVEAQANGLPIIASSEGIPNSAKMSKNFDFLSLDDSIDNWCNTIINQQLVNRSKENIIFLTENGFDIETECKKLLEEFHNE